VITYIDTSALLKLIIDEDGSERALTIWSSVDALASVNLIVVEACAALAAARRVRRPTEAQHRSAVTELDALVSDLHIVPVTDELVASAQNSPTTKDFAATTQFTSLLHSPSKRPYSAAPTLRSAPPPPAADCTSPTRSEAETGASRPPIVGRDYFASRKGRTRTPGSAWDR
jgi:uncharacterized protein with PIN domain